MNEKILLVDDDAHVLDGYRRQIRRQFVIETAVGPQLGAAAVEQRGPFAVVVSDLRMPGMDGVEFLAFVRRRSPDTVRIMLSGQADLDAAIAAVNEGNIFRFLTKPCSPPSLMRALSQSMEQHRLIVAERQLLEKTLKGSVSILTEILSLLNPGAFGRASRVRRLVREIVTELKLANQWQFELAAMLSHIGCITLPPRIVEKALSNKPLSNEEKKLMAGHPAVGRSLIEKIPRLESVARIIEKQQCSYARRVGHPEDPVTLGSQILRVVLDFDRLVAGGLSANAAVAAMCSIPTEYNPIVLEALQRMEGGEGQTEERLVNVDQLKASMILEQDVHTRNGMLLVAKGQEVTTPVIARLRKFAETIGVSEPLHVRLSRSHEEDGREVTTTPCGGQIHGT